MLLHCTNASEKVSENMSSCSGAILFCEKKKRKRDGEREEGRRGVGRREREKGRKGVTEGENKEGTLKKNEREREG